MSPVVSPHIALRFRVPIALEDNLQGFMLMQMPLEGIEEADGETCYYVKETEWTPAREQALGLFLTSTPAIRFLGAESIEDRDWSAEWRESVQPERATPQLVITPAWHKAAALAMGAKYLIEIDPKMSFGTGHHETTRLCLRALETIECAGKTVLDLGTGTGVLAIYALMRGATSAIGVDTDRWSIENAEENRGLNDFSPEQLDIRAGTLQDAVGDAEVFDIILANIHRHVLLELAKDIRAHVRPGGFIILSGLLSYDAVEVRAAYERAGFDFLARSEENEWDCLTFQFPIS
ncbi:MAG: 50S ribosomal protein L11 methyltransferase [Bacteroidota bacterium]|nr:50S ribosomal protein L11 methyltransferase [Bacteroidota bacterium]MDP4232195.1 50S ribosomal protein L11 methyltransferase [Bacteroidota bacterium]MDP4243624.1 50S ribosomal protein L11 methyltransferase [Bacteroidota bacterium]MDP4288722.1 50S ribosomal protein L11 methyltransferase [Bacteroidota bacterium]